MAESLSAQVDEIAVKVEQFEASKDALSRAERLRLVQSLENLTHKLKDPKDAIYDHLTNVFLPPLLGIYLVQLTWTIGIGGAAEYSSLGSGTISATDLAAKTGADRVLIIRLMRILTVTGIFELVSPDEYAHTPYFLAYIDGHEIVSSDPRRLKQFNIAMSTQDHILPVLGMYPFGEELSNAPDTCTRPLLVDIGGGRGQSLIQIKEKWPNLKGRLILQDRQMVVDSCPELLGIEKMAHDFFTEQPVKHAHAYYIRRCIHNWTDEQCTTILKAIVPAMAPDSRVLVGEMVVLEYNSPRPGGIEDMAPYWMDHNMYAFGGRERTRTDFQSLFSSAGLKLVKVWQSEASSQAVLEARLA